MNKYVLRYVKIGGWGVVSDIRFISLQLLDFRIIRFYYNHYSTLLRRNIFSCSISWATYIN
jgi:hypothetical protein